MSFATDKEQLIERELIPIDFSERADYTEWLTRFQGNILTAFSGDEACMLGFRFNTEVEPWQKRRAASRIGLQFLTTAYKQHTQSVQKVACNVLLSAQGFHALNVPEKLWPTDNAFRSGMRERDLGDPDVGLWESAYQQPIHLAFLLRADERSQINIAVDQIEGSLKLEATLVVKEDGGLRYNSEGKTIEPFGFVDGVSQPIFFKSDMPNNCSHWNPSASPSLVLTPDRSPATGFGSYLVYRKLAQDKLGFEGAVDDLIASLDLDEHQRAYAEALIVGRFKDGSPLALTGETGVAPCAQNFNYITDETGNRCPLQAHIRKMNPRGDVSAKFGVAQTQERLHRIVRRSLVYGDLDATRGEVGMLFFCFQSSINAQFEVLQQAWANRSDFVQEGTGCDPLVGQRSKVNADASCDDNGSWPKSWDNNARCNVSLTSFVELRGGEYFFSPSPEFFKLLE